MEIPIIVACNNLDDGYKLKCTNNAVAVSITFKTPLVIRSIVFEGRCNLHRIKEDINIHTFNHLVKVFLKVVKLEKYLNNLK
jgi:hypothetical protein